MPKNLMDFDLKSGEDKNTELVDSIIADASDEAERIASVAFLMLRNAKIGGASTPSVDVTIKLVIGLDGVHGYSIERASKCERVIRGKTDLITKAYNPDQPDLFN